MSFPAGEVDAPVPRNERLDRRPGHSKGQSERIVAGRQALQTFSQKRIDSLLDPREQKVLRLKLGLEDGRHYNNHEIKIEFGVGAERIRQIEAWAIAKLTKELQKGRGCRT